MSGVSNGTLPLETLRKWLGERAILLPLPFGEKKPVWPDWQSTTFERTQESDYQEKLRPPLIAEAT